MNREFEFEDGLRRYAIVWRCNHPLPCELAANIVERTLFRDRSRLSSFVAWARFEGHVTAIGFGPYDLNHVANTLLQRIRIGSLQVRECEGGTVRTYTHSLAPPESFTYEPSKPEALVDDDRSLSISRCDPELRPDQPLRFTYSIRGLSGRPVTLRFVSESFSGRIVHERPLTPAETADGFHDMEWDGLVTSGGEFQGRRLPAKYSPAKVEVEHDATYRDDEPFTIPHRRVVIIQFEDLSFATNRSILLPRVRQPVGDQPAHARDRVGGLDVIAAALRFIDRYPNKSVLVAGHTDTAGSQAHNLSLSELRAHNVTAFLVGDAGAWAEQCQATYEIADFKTVHRWAAEEFGWNTDPGELDNKWTNQARVARDEFRQRCNAELGLELTRHVKQNKADWEAIFALYDRALMRRLECDEAMLRALREQVSFLEPPAIGCGEHWPVEAMGIDNHALEENRRVELLFFDPGEEPELSGDPPGVEIYGRGEYRPEYIPAKPHTYDGSRDYEVWIELRDHWLRPKLTVESYMLSGPLPERTFAREGKLDGFGRLREAELAPGDYLVEVGVGFTVVGARYAKLCYVDDQPDVYRLLGWSPDDVPPSRPRVYDEAWTLRRIEEDDFVEDADEPSISEPEADEYDYEVWAELRDHWLRPLEELATYALTGPIPSEEFRRSGVLDERGRLREIELPPGEYVVEVDDSFTVVGARYARMCYVDDEPDVYRLSGVRIDDPPQERPRVYENSWTLLRVGSEDFFEDTTDPWTSEDTDADLGAGDD